MIRPATVRTSRRRFIGGGACLVAGAGLSMFLGGCTSKPSPATGGPVPRLHGRTNPKEKRGTPGNLRLGLVRPGTTGAPPLTDLESLLVHARLVAVDPRNGEVHGDLATS